MAFYLYQCPVCQTKIVERKPIDQRDDAPICCDVKTVRQQTAPEFICQKAAG